MHLRPITKSKPALAQGGGPLQTLLQILAIQQALQSIQAIGLTLKRGSN